MAIIKNKFAGKIEAGKNNTSSGDYSSSIAGQNNCATSAYSVIVGGCGNISSGYGSMIGGGIGNCAAGVCSFIGGGSGNRATQLGASVIGGSANCACGQDSIAGGFNTVAGGCSIAMGYQSQATSAFGFSTGYNSLSSGAHGMALGYNACAAGRESIALGRSAAALECGATAFTQSRASGCYSVAGAEGCTTGKNSIAFGKSAYTNLTGQFALSSGKAIYDGANQVSLISGKLDSGLVASGGSYNFTLGDGSAINFQTAFTETVPYNMFIKATIVFGARGVASNIATIAQNDLYTASYELCVRKKMSGAREILGTPQLTNSFSDPNLSGTSVSFSISGGTDLIVTVTPPTWEGGNIRFIGTLSIFATQMGMHQEAVPI